MKSPFFEGISEGIFQEITNENVEGRNFQEKLPKKLSEIAELVTKQIVEGNCIKHCLKYVHGKSHNKELPLEFPN